MCGALPCNPMHDRCTWSWAYVQLCREMPLKASQLIALQASDWDAAMKDFRAYEQRHGKTAADALRREIKKQKGK
ncbi:hypothetical protein [Petrachloros mirabilis]